MNGVTQVWILWNYSFLELNVYSKVDIYSANIGSYNLYNPSVGRFIYKFGCMPSKGWGKVRKVSTLVLVEKAPLV